MSAPNESGAAEITWRVQEQLGPGKLYFLTPREVSSLNRDLPGQPAGWEATNLHGMHGEVMPDMTPPAPQAQLGDFRSYERPYACFADTRVTFVGAGAGAILLGTHLVERGMDPRNMTFIDPRGTFGGQWCTPQGRAAGFNNPRPLSLWDRYRLSLDDRDGAVMAGLLDEIAGDNLFDAPLIAEAATTFSRRPNGLWQITNEANETHEADFVVLGHGASVPRRIDGPRIRSNLDTLSAYVNDPDRISVEHYQRILTDADFASGRPIVLIGLGNSTAGMLRQIQDYERQHNTSINYVVLTDRTKRALRFPGQAIDGLKPIFRDPPAGYLTGYSGDLTHDYDSYWEAFNEERLLGDVGGIMFGTRDDGLRITNREGQPLCCVLQRPLVFSLIGYDRDPEPFEAVGAVRSPEPVIRPSDGAIYTHRDGFRSNAFAVGAAAAGRTNPNAAVLPGIIGQIPRTTLTMAVRRYLRTPRNS